MLCTRCLQLSNRTYLILESRKRNAQQHRDEMLAVCMECTATMQPQVALACVSLDCPIFVERTKALRVSTELESLGRRMQLNNLSW